MMHRPSGATSRSLEYSTLRGRWPWKSYLLGVATPPAIYLVTYVLLRLSGVYYPSYHTGGWDIDGTTHVSMLDAAFIPATIVETHVQNRLRWLKEPTGG